MGRKDGMRGWVERMDRKESSRGYVKRMPS